MRHTHSSLEYARDHILQTDPVGYEDDLNIYAYVRNDPVNFTDPTGAFKTPEQVLAERLARAGVTSQLDGPEPGPADVVAAVMVGAALGSYAAALEEQERTRAEFVNLDNTALIHAIEQPTSQTEFLSPEFGGTGRGDMSAYNSFMAQHGGVVVPNPPQATVDYLTARGLSETDAKVVGAGAEVGAATLTRDNAILRRTPELSEPY